MTTKATKAYISQSITDAEDLVTLLKVVKSEYNKDESDEDMRKLFEDIATVKNDLSLKITALKKELV